jgi:hypothetical protein
VLELEPSEADDLLMPPPDSVTKALTQKVDELLRERRLTEALDLVDQVLLVEGLGFEPQVVHDHREAWMRLRDRRTKRK